VVVRITLYVQKFPFKLSTPIPVTIPDFASKKETHMRSAAVLLFWLIQVVPPFVVRRIVPPSPTAVPVIASLNETLLRKASDPLV
jgi:hypothetical protein